jgi:hypothetical protein
MEPLASAPVRTVKGGPFTDSPPRPKRRRRWPLLAVGLVIVACLVGWFGWRQIPDEHGIQIRFLALFAGLALGTCVAVWGAQFYWLLRDSLRQRPAEKHPTRGVAAVVDKAGAQLSRSKPISWPLVILLWPMIVFRRRRPKSSTNHRTPPADAAAARAAQ